MQELNLACMKMYRSVVVGALGTVLNISFDGAVEAGQGRADLMVTSGFGINFDKRVVVAHTNYLVAQFRLFSIRTGLFECEGLVEFLVLPQIVDDFRFRFFRGAFHDSPVRFLYLAVLEHIG